jgi:tetratricopeptide (TPR) repeat protein
VKKTLFILPAALWLSAALLAPRLRPHDYTGGRSRDETQRVLANQSSLALMLGEFRTSLSDVLFIKTERYLHSGVAYVPHLTEKILTVEGAGEAVGEHEHGEHCDHENDHFAHEGMPVTVVPESTQDYRGWIGDMHREVKPWRDPKLAHQHTTGTELIPWFRMMTLSDPSYTRGYTVGAFWIKQHDPEAALRFIEEGIGHNPRAFELHLARGFLLLQEGRALQEAGKDGKEVMLRAKSAFQSAAEYLPDVRPKTWEGEIEDAPGWGNYQESDAMAALLMAVLFEENYGDPARARELAQKYLELMPEHPRLRVFIQQSP